MEVCTLLPEEFSVVGQGDLMGVYADRSGFRLQKRGNSITPIWGVAILGGFEANRGRSAV